MRALWSDRPKCSHNVSQKAKCIRRPSEHEKKVPDGTWRVTDFVFLKPPPQGLLNNATKARNLNWVSSSNPDFGNVNLFTICLFTILLPFNPPPLPNQQSDGFPLESVLKGPQTELRTLSKKKTLPNCEQAELWTNGRFWTLFRLGFPICLCTVHLPWAPKTPLINLMRCRLLD